MTSREWLSLCPFLFWSEGHALLFIYYIYKEYLFNNINKSKMTNLHLDNRNHNYLYGGKNE